MRFQLLLLISILLIGLSCTKENVFRAYCINERIKEYKEDHKCKGARISRWYYLGRTVYVFDPGECAVDNETKTLFDEDCQIICYVGGLAATQNCEGKNFYNKSFLKVTLWKYKE